MTEPGDPQNRSSPEGAYKVGYKKPPVEHQFKAKHLRPQSGNRLRSVIAPNVAAMLDKPLKVKRSGNVVTMHPYEASLTALARKALKGEPRAIKQFLRECEKAGLLDPPPAEKPSAVFVVPKDANSAVVKVLVKNYGLPPWDPKIYAELEAELDHDLAHIEILYQQTMKEREHEQQV